MIITAVYSPELTELYLSNKYPMLNRYIDFDGWELAVNEQTFYAVNNTGIRGLIEDFCFNEQQELDVHWRTKQIQWCAFKGQSL